MSTGAFCTSGSTPLRWLRRQESATTERTARLESWPVVTKRSWAARTRAVSTISVISSPPDRAVENARSRGDRPAPAHVRVYEHEPPMRAHFRPFCRVITRK